MLENYEMRPIATCAAAAYSDARGKDVIAIDIDGVISPLPSDERDCMYEDIRLFNAKVRPEVGRFLADLASRDSVDLRWHTSWRENSVVFADFFDFENPPQFDAEPHFSCGWWKAASVKRWLDDPANADRRLLWIDDDLMLMCDDDDLVRELLQHERVSHICPLLGVGGLSDSDLKMIDSWVAGERVTSVIFPDENFALPVEVGSRIAVLIPGTRMMIVAVLDDADNWFYVMGGHEFEPVTNFELMKSIRLPLPPHFMRENSDSFV